MAEKTYILTESQIKQIKVDAIDEFAELIESALLNAKFDIKDVRPMAEQLKENKNDNNV